MKCPRCQEILRRKIHSEPRHMLVIDCCPRCRGNWFGAEQLRELETIVEPALIEFRHIPAREEQLVIMQCPSCEDRLLLKAEHGRDRQVIMDYCPQCTGIWLDAGELDAIQKESWLITLGRAFRFISGSG